MKKPSKKRIEQVATKLREVFVGFDPTWWHSRVVLQPLNESPDRQSWRRIAAFALTELQTAPSLRAVPAAKSCKVVRGKTVCK